jgi:autotransporter-associated beta strand protein
MLAFLYRTQVHIFFASLLFVYRAAIAQSTPFAIDREYLNQEALNTIKAYSAGYANITGLGIKIGQLDTGTTPTHIEFANAIAAGINTMTGVIGVSSSVIGDAGAPFDHGTLVGSIMLARRDGSTRPGNMEGLAYNSRLVIGSSFTTFAYDTINSQVYLGANDALMANAVNYVANQGVKVINNSYGFYNSYETLQSRIPLTLKAYENAAKTAVMVFAAGNNAVSNLPNNLIANPAALPYFNSNLPHNWISVVATTNDGSSMARGVGTAYPAYPSTSPNNPALTYSNLCGVTAAYCVSAPGGYALGGGGGANYNQNISVFITGGPLVDSGMTGAYGGSTDQYYSAKYFPGQYNGMGGSGTSFAAALTSATVALVAEKYPWMTPEQLTATVLTTASHASEISPVDGRGMLNVEAAIKGPAIFERTFNVDTQGYNSVFQNDISGSGGLVKSGVGSLVLTGTGTYQGGTTVNFGTLTFDGQGPSKGNVVVNGGVLQVGSSLEYTSASLGGNFAIQKAGSLFGYGTIGNAASTVSNSGVIGVSIDGTAVGVLKIAGNFVQSTTGVYIANLVNNSADSIRVDGKAQLAGSLDVYATSPQVKAVKYALLTSGGRTGQFTNFQTNLAAYTSMPFYLSYDNQNVYLVLPPDAQTTLTSIQNSANLLAGAFSAQTAAQFSGLDYGCNTFGTNNLCLSVGGRGTKVSNGAQGYSTGGGLIIGGYKISSSLRAGGWLDEGFSSSGSNVRMSNGNPMFGLFGTYAPKSSNAGVQITGSVSYGANSATITREQLMNMEAGSGVSNFTSVAAKAELSYGIDPGVFDMKLSPFVGLRYYYATFNGYTEAAQFPISYSSAKISANTAILGLRVNGRFYENWGAMFAVGGENDFSRSNPVFSGSSSIVGLTSFSVQPDYVTQNTRPFANVGLYYYPDKNSVLGITTYYRQDFYRPMNSLSTTLTYSIGL